MSTTQILSGVAECVFKLADWEANQQIGRAGNTSALRPLIGGFPNWTVVYYVECDFVRVFFFCRPMKGGEEDARAVLSCKLLCKLNRNI